MTKKTSVEIGDELADYLDGQIRSGRYRSASEAVREGLRYLQDRDTKMAALRAALKAGEESGAPVPFDVDKFISGQNGHD